MKQAVRRQTAGEELANTLSHGLGFILALGAAPFLLSKTVAVGDTAQTLGAIAFVVAAALLYLSSSIYHALPIGKAKEWFDRVDHAAIYLLIAGSYTPFTLGVLRGAWGWTLFGLVWTMALVGVVLKVSGKFRNRTLSTALYLLMGWLVVVAIRPMWQRMEAEGLFWLVAGGVAYTLGVLFYNAKERHFTHFIWHLFVLAGTACHYWAILWYSAA